MAAISVPMSSAGARFRRPVRKGHVPSWLGSRTRVAVGLAVLAWLVVFVGAGIGSAGTGGDSAASRAVLASGRTHQVASGETLWSIAASSGAGGDTREVVQEMVALNHLSGTAITPGQVLELP